MCLGVVLLSACLFSCLNWLWETVRFLWWEGGGVVLRRVGGEVFEANSLWISFPVYIRLFLEKMSTDPHSLWESYNHILSCVHNVRDFLFKWSCFNGKCPNLLRIHCETPSIRLYACLHNVRGFLFHKRSYFHELGNAQNDQKVPTLMRNPSENAKKGTLWSCVAFPNFPVVRIQKCTKWLKRPTLVRTRSEYAKQGILWLWAAFQSFLVKMRYRPVWLCSLLRFSRSGFLAML